MAKFTHKPATTGTAKATQAGRTGTQLAANAAQAPQGEASSGIDLEERGKRRLPVL